MEKKTAMFLFGGAALAALLFTQKDKIKSTADNFVMSTVKPLEAIRISNEALKKFGITNRYVRAAILATIYKESGFVPKNETAYNKTKNSSIRMLFGNRNGLASKSEEWLTELKADRTKFFDFMYGGAFGLKNFNNTEPHDGSKYAGRGLNGLTGRSQYALHGKILGIDLINNPDQLNELPKAAASAALYFKQGFDYGKSSGLLKKKIGVEDWKTISDLNTAVKLAVQSNFGWKGDLSTPAGQLNLSRALAAKDAMYKLSA